MAMETTMWTSFIPAMQFFPFTPAVFGMCAGADGRGGVDLFVVSRMKRSELIDKGYVFFESDAAGEPMLPAIRALVDGIGHGAWA